MFPFAKLHPVQARGSDGASLRLPVPGRARRQAGLGQSPSFPGLAAPRPRRAERPPCRRPCLPAAAHGPVLLPHKRLICYIFSDAVNGRTKTFSLSYFCSIMFVGEPDPLQRGAEEPRGSLPGVLTSQACSWALLLGPGVAKREGSEGPLRVP